MQIKIQSLFSFQQVTKAYQAKVEELINQGLDEEELRSKQDLLKVRKYYDSIILFCDFCMFCNKIRTVELYIKRRITYVEALDEFNRNHSQFCQPRKSEDYMTGV